MDAILATAYTLSKDLLCSGCGMPKFEAWNPDSGGYYEIQEEWCSGCAAIEQDEKRNKDANGRRDRITWVTETPDHPHGGLRPYEIGRQPSGNYPQ